MEKNIIDSYPETNNSTYGQMTGTYPAHGQTITGTGQKIVKAYFYLAKVGSPTGNMVYKIYAMAGTHGSSGKPTGDALAQSESKDISEIGSSYELVGLDFIGENQIELEDGVNYCLVAESPNGVSSNYLKIGIDFSSPTHDGNYFYKAGSTWYADSGNDIIFYAVARDQAPSNFFALFN